MNQVLAILEEEEDVFVSADVCLQPPADGRESDGDTDDEDDPVLDASHFSKDQLLAEACRCLICSLTMKLFPSLWR